MWVYHTNWYLFHGTLLSLLSFLSPLSLLSSLPKVTADGRSFFRSRRNIVCFTALAVAAGDIAYAYATPYTWWRVAPLARIAVLATYSRGARAQGSILMRALPHFFPVLLMYVSRSLSPSLYHTACLLEYVSVCLVTNW